MGNRVLEGEYDFSTAWDECDKQNGIRYVWCKTKTIGQAPTNYVVSGLIGGFRDGSRELGNAALPLLKDGAKGLGSAAGDILGGVVGDLKTPLIIGGGVLLLILILK